ncbi:MAG: 5-formyltetrahydrofolate cyclo-ligase [Pseudomonadota bacterium]
MNDKYDASQLRKQHLAARRARDPARCRDDSAKIVARLEPYIAKPHYRRIALYAPINNEVDATAIMRRHADREYCYPRICADHMLEFRSVKTMSNMRRGPFGILEPNVDESTVVATRDIDLFIVPLVVFDRNCHRIGMGKGFYDRALAEVTVNPQHFPMLIGVAYASQCTAVVRPQSWDVQLDAVITEQRVVYNSDAAKRRTT